jgi:sterol O-acyltransferase
VSDYQLWQAFYLAAVVGWAFFREWEWPQTVFIVLHCLVLLMKQHSYAFYSGWLSNVYLRRARLQNELQKLRVDDLASEAKIEEDDDSNYERREERMKLTRDIENCEKDLVGKVQWRVEYPGNLTFANFLDYMFCPTLVYELEYPRTDRYISLRTSCELDVGPAAPRPLRFLLLYSGWLIVEFDGGTLLRKQ